MILKNDVHHTAVQINLCGRDYLTLPQIRRAARVLCPGQCDCCSGIAGERGPQTDAKGQRFYLVAGADATAVLIPW